MADLISPSAATPLLMALMVGAMLLWAGVSRRELRLRLLAPGYFAAVAFLVKLFYSSKGQPLCSLWAFTATTEGLAEGTLLAGRVLGGAMLVFFLSMTTPVSELVFLASRLRLPPVIIEITVVMYRFLFLLAEEGERIKEAQRLRLGHSNFRASIASHGTLAGMLFISAYDRSERVYEALLARGYKGGLPVGQGRPLTRRDWGHVTALGLVVCLALAIGCAAAWLF